MKDDRECFTSNRLDPNCHITLLAVGPTSVDAWEVKEPHKQSDDVEANQTSVHRPIEAQVIKYYHSRSTTVRG